MGRRRGRGRGRGRVRVRGGVRPGKMYMLLHCEGARVLPPCCTGSKGEPVATMARPSVQLYAWRRWW